MAKKMKRIGAVMLCLCMLGGVLLNGLVLPTKANADETPPAAFSADFADLAALVASDDFEGGVYTSKATDQAINQWIGTRFDIYATLQGGSVRERAYLGQNSQAMESDNMSWGGVHRWVIAQDGHLQHTVTSQGGEMLRKGEQMVLKTASGAQAQLENFEATIVFNTMQNGCGAIALSFHEKTAGRVINNVTANLATSNAVIIGNGAGGSGATSTDGIMIRKNGSAHSKTNIVDTAAGLVASERFATAFAQNTDYVLYVKVLEGTVTVKVTSADGATEFYNKTFANAVESYNGTISVGAANANRAFKSIVVRELDAEGNYVAFGSNTTNISTFTEKFNNLWEYSGGKYVGSMTDSTKDAFYFNMTNTGANPAAVTEVAQVLNIKFNEYMDFYGGYEKLNFGTVYTTSFGETASFQELLSNHCFQRVATPNWNRNMRLISSMVPKSERTGEELKMTNLETYFEVYWDSATSITTKEELTNNTAPGSVVFGFRQQKPGAFTKADQVLREDTAFIVLSQTGFTVLGGAECAGTNTHPGLFNQEADEYSFFDYNEGYTPQGNAVFNITIRIVGNDVKLRIVKSGTDIFNNFEGGAQANVIVDAGGYVEEGTVAFGIGEKKAGLRNIQLTRLDVNGKAIDLDAESDGTAAAEYAVDFSDLAALIPANTYTDGLYSSKYDDEEINKWANKRFNIYFGKEQQATTPQLLYLGQSSYALLADSGENTGWGGEHKWLINQDGYLQYDAETVPYETVRKGEQLAVKTADGALAQMENFEATMVFNTLDNNKGGVAISFHEKAESRVTDQDNAARSNSNVVYILNNNDRAGFTTSADAAVVRASGKTVWKPLSATEYGDGILLKDMFGDSGKNLEKNTDYKLFVRVLNKEVVIRVTSVDGSEEYYSGATTLESSYNGGISFGVFDSDRAIKSIAVKEMDENGVYVDFGTHTWIPEKFTFSFDNLLKYNNGTGNSRYADAFNNAATSQWWLNTTDSNVKAEVKAELLYHLQKYFDEYLDATSGKLTKTNFLKVDGAGTAYGNGGPDNAGFWQVLSDTWIQRELSNVYWKESMRLVSTMVPKSAITGEQLKMTNFETSFDVLFEEAKGTSGNGTTEKTLGSAIVSFREQTPGKITGGSKLYKEHAFVSITQSGITVAGGNDIQDSMYDGDDNNATYQFTDYTPKKSAIFNIKIRVVGDACYVQVSEGGKDLFNNFAGGKDSDFSLDLGGYMKEGTISFGIGEVKAGIRKINLVKLDEDGTPTDIDPYVAADDEDEIIDAEQFTFDASIGDYAGGSAALDAQADALKVLNTKFMHYFVHGDTYEDYPWYGNAGGDDGCGNWHLADNAWLSRVDVKNGGERLRQINALIPKDANGNAAQTENLIAEFDYRFDNENSTVVFGFRQKNPAKFINGTGRMNQEQVLVAINKTALSVKGGTGITTEEFYSEKSTYSTYALALKDIPDAIHVRIKAVGSECTVTLSNIDGKLLAKNVFTVTNTGTGYMALGVAAGEGSIGDVTITRLDDAGQPADFTVRDYQDKVYDDGILRFSADFAGLASLAETFKSGVYVPTATDRAINHWFDSRFALYFNLNYRGTIHEKNFAGESSSVYDADDSKSDEAWRGGEVYWQLNQNGYLTHYAGGTGWEMMRKIQALTLKAPDGNIATVKNFEATFTVHDEKQAEGAVLLSFRNDKDDTISSTGGSVYANQQLLAIGYDGSGKAGMNLGGGATELANTYDVFKTPLDKLQGVTDYKVYIKVLGEDIIVKITSPDELTSYYDNSATPAKAVMQDAGYMMIGVSNSTKSLVDLTVTELDDDGNAIDFGTNTGKGDIFAFSVTDAVSCLNGKYENGENWIDFTGPQTDPEAETTGQMINLLNSRFAIYYNHQSRYQQTEAGLRETYAGQTNDFAYLGRLFANKWLQRLVENSGGKQTMRLITGLVPRNTNTGEELRMKNFETSFQFRFETTGYHSEAAILGFRQQTPGKFVDGYFNVNKQQGLVIVTRHGISVAAGEDIFSGQHMTEDGKETHRPLDGDIYDGAQAISFDDPATADVTEMLPQTIGIKVRVVEDQLWLTVTDAGGVVLFDNGGKPFTVNYDKEGYIAYGLGNWQAGIADIKLARLDENGKQIDINNASSSVDAQWDVTAARYSRIMDSLKNDIVTALDYYYSSMKEGSTVVTKETMDAHWAFNDNRILMRHSDLSDNATSNIATMKWNLFEEKETIQNYDAVFKLHLDDDQDGTFWVVSGQTDKANIGKVTATDGGTDHIAGQMAVGLAVGGDITVAPGDGTSVTMQGPAIGTPTGIYNLRVRVSGGMLEVYVNGTLRVIRALDASAIGEGYLYYGYSGAALGIAEVNVTRLNEYGVAVDFTTAYTDVEAVADRMVDKDATKAELNLPTTLKVYKGTEEETSNVYWDCSGIDFTAEGEYFAIGYLENTNGIRAVAKVQIGKYDPENTVVYSFSDNSVLDKLDTYFLPEASTGNQPAIHVKDTAEENWYVSDGKLRIKHNSYRRSKAELLEGFEINGVKYQNTDNVFASFQSNIAIAVLKEQTYKNFILDLDYRGYYDWSFVGIDADATDVNSVFGSQDNGGTAFFVAYNSGTAGINTWADGKCWNTSNSLKPYDISAGNEQHHMRIIVSDGMAYFYLDDIASPVTLQLPDDYDGGYIYLGLNSTECYFDNLKITDLDAKKIEITDLKNTVDEITIDRSKGDTFSLPTKAVAVDKNGYEYTLPIDWENGEYRSGTSGDYAFTPAISLHNISVGDGISITVKNRVNGEYDENTSVKYYFDHKNDLLDFNSYYSEPLAKENVPSHWDESKWGTMYNAHNGNLTHSEDPLSRWTVTADGATTVRSNSNGGWGEHKLFTNLETMTLKEELKLNLKSYKLEMDFNHALGDWWYTYMLFGVQDPSKYMSRWASHDGTYSQYARQYAKEGGVYYWIEQEGFMNIMGALITGGERVQMDGTYIYNNPFWPGAYVRNNTHHLTVYVFDQRAFVQVDDSGYVEIALTPNAVGGLAGFASHGNDSTISNFQLTAIDGDTFDPINDTCTAVPLATAERGWAPDQSYDDFNAWKPSDEDLEYDWKDHITSF